MLKPVKELPALGERIIKESLSLIFEVIWLGPISLTSFETWLVHHLKYAIGYYDAVNVVSEINCLTFIGPLWYQGSFSSSKFEVLKNDVSILLFY